MPSRRLLRLLPLRRRSPRWLAKAVAPLLAAALAGACAPKPPPAPLPEKPPELPISHRDRAYLIDPLEGYGDAVPEEVRDRLQRAFRDLLERADVEGARATASELIEGDAELLPALVLAAQVDFAEGRPVDVVTRLVPVGDRKPGYVASQLLLGRAAEQAGDLPLAYSAFRAIATRSQVALQRLGELHPRAMEILSNRLQEALRNQRFDEAEKHLALLQSWGAEETVTLEGARSLAVARGDRRAELTAVKELSARRPKDRELLERRADLELAVGDPGAGLQIVQDLATREPGNPALQEKLAAAKYRWRLSLLPPEIQEIAGRAELSRGDFAVLLYWLIPNVRYARPSSGRIATDVLDSLHQEEIVRVVNLGLMDVDATLHRFSPAAGIRWGTALRTLARVLALGGSAGDCLGGATGQSPQSAICAAAADCGLIPSADDCQVGTPLAGSDAVELIRRTLKRLGGS
jgi:hypothetical protein